MSTFREAVSEVVRTKMREEYARREKELEDAMIRSYETGQPVTVDFPEWWGVTTRYVVDAKAFHKGNA